MIPIEEKKAFLEALPRVSLHVVTKDMVDGVVFRSAGHSLGADLLKVFERAVEELDRSEAAVEEHELEKNHVFQTERYDYEVDWNSGIPLLFCRER